MPRIIALGHYQDEDGVDCIDEIPEGPYYPDEVPCLENYDEIEYLDVPCYTR